MMITADGTGKNDSSSSSSIKSKKLTSRTSASAEETAMGAAQRRAAAAAAKRWSFILEGECGVLNSGSSGSGSGVDVNSATFRFGDNVTEFSTVTCRHTFVSYRRLSMRDFIECGDITYDVGDKK
jgi:hypothetical protein